MCHPRERCSHLHRDGFFSPISFLTNAACNFKVFLAQLVVFEAQLTREIKKKVVDTRQVKRKFPSKSNKNVPGLLSRALGMLPDIKCGVRLCIFGSGACRQARVGG
ncbi:MAG TPA: hypothetical protein DD706_12395 [Nitrospiraceae bacterium]|nr:hypothetical protein [Nitrospiraceae bacterium]